MVDRDGNEMSRDTEAQIAELDRRMAGDGWVRPQLLEYMRSAPDFYFDEMSQIKMDHWAKGRVVLAGDAGYCCSPLSGQGTSVALVGGLHPGPGARRQR